MQISVNYNWSLTQLVNVIIEHLLCRDTLNYQKYTLISSQVTSYELARLFTLCRWQVSQNPVQISMHDHAYLHSKSAKILL